MMTVISPCMTWVPILWGQLLELFVKNRAVDNLPHLIAVDHSLHDLPVVDDPPSFLVVGNPLPYLPSIDDPFPEFRAVDDPLPDLSGVDNPLPVVDNPLLDIPAIGKPLTDLPAVDDPLPEIPAVGNPPPVSLAVVDPHPNLREVDGPLPDLQVVGDPLPDLPYHIITDILSRLSAKCVIQSQCVSRPLYVLTTTPFFIHTHLNRACSVIVVQSHTQTTDRDIKLYFIDLEMKIEATSMKLDFNYLRKSDPIILFGSKDGFLLFRNKFVWEPVFIIWNSITKEQVTVTSPCSHLYVCGFYFHALKKEHEVLALFRNGAKLEFQILGLRTKSWRNIGSCSYPPYRERHPTIVNGTLYWMVDVQRYRAVNNVCPSRWHSILSFKIETEEFSTMEHGGHSDMSCIYHGQMHLFEMDGQLCLCEPLSTTKLVLWVLNHSTKCWMKRHTVTLPMGDWEVNFEIWPSRFFSEVIRIRKGELLLRQRDRLLCYNLDLGTCKIFEKRGYEGDNFGAVVHTHSLLFG